MKLAILLVASAIFLAGYATTDEIPVTTETPSPSPVEPTVVPTETPVPTPQEPTATPALSPAPATTATPAGPVDVALPSIRATSASPSNPDRNEPVNLSVSAEEDVGLKELSWESADELVRKPETNSFECGSQKTCAVSWEFASAQDGTKIITVYATDSSGKQSPKVPIEISVRPFDYKPRPSPTPTPSAPFCGNGVCDAGEAFEVCPADCPFAGPKCANGKCEGGESYQSCPQDCSVSAIVGSTCNDGACEPGEDAANCPRDCVSIRPNCGNNVCDSWENRTTCLADCEAVSGGEKTCNSNAACGYRQICQSGKCVTVDCTNDGQCGYGRECENNRCVRCPSGPYGPAC